MELNNITCPICGKAFQAQSSVKRHMGQKHRPENLSFLCHECGLPFTTKKCVLQHLKNFHGVVGISRDRLQICPVPSCGSNFVDHGQILEHLSASHEITVDVEDLEFSTFEEFKSWFAIEQEQTLTGYVSRNAQIYICNRSGSRKPRGKGKNTSWKPSKKIGKCCPARLVVREVEGKTRVKYYKTHVGHINRNRYVNLTEEERVELSGRLDSGVPLERILEDIRESYTGGRLSRLHMIEKKDLHNIIRDFGLRRDRLHQDEFTSTMLWIQSQKDLGDNSPLIFYKNQGTDEDVKEQHTEQREEMERKQQLELEQLRQQEGQSELEQRQQMEQLVNQHLEQRQQLEEVHRHQLNLGNDDFMLVLMTPYQRKSVMTVKPTWICVDSTHGITRHGYQLTLLVTLDESGAGCPLAMCLSTRTDVQTMKSFFGAVKLKTGVLDAEYLMSDDAKCYYNAWREVMTTPRKKLLCMWHVDKAWRNNLWKVRGALKKAEVYKGCRTLIAHLDETDFPGKLERFLDLCYADADTFEFGIYFQRIYAHRYEEWAFCARKGVGLNTNMFVESMIRHIKYEYFKGQKNSRVDTAITLLLKFARDTMFDQGIRDEKNKPTYRMKEVVKAHKKGITIPVSDITRLEEEVWTVESQSTRGTSYIVYMSTDIRICNECPLTCPIAECKACPHRSSCDCVDNIIKGNVCKHVHAVCLQQQPAPVEADARRCIPMEVCESLELTQPGNQTEGEISSMDRMKAFTSTFLGYYAGADTSIEEECTQLMNRLIELARANQVRDVAGPSRAIAHNEKIEKQPRMWNVNKRKKRKTTHVDKPLINEERCLSQLLSSRNEDEEIPVIASTSSMVHSYHFQE